MTQSDPSSALPTLLLIATGGTIAMKNDPATGAPVPAVTGEDLLATVPGIASLCQIEVNNLCNVPSPNMGPERWQELHAMVLGALKRTDIAGVIITHGTDTLEETAWFLELTIQSDQAVVLTGAQRNHSDADFDGPTNLHHAILTALDPNATKMGVVLVMNGEIHGAREVTKTHTSALDTFQSGSNGPLGRIRNNQVEWLRTPPPSPHVPLENAPLPSVEIIPCFGGVRPTLLQAALKAGAQGLVIQALGIGNVNYELHEAIAKALAQGLPVVISTRVPQGGTAPHYGYPGGGQQLQKLGALFADDLNPQKARILLMLSLQQARTPAQITALWNS